MLSRFSPLALVALMFGAGVCGARAASGSDAGVIRNLILEAQAAGHRGVRIPPGTYRLSAEKEAGACLHFEGLKDFEIDATGVTFLCVERRKITLFFEDCERVSLRGAVFRHDPVPFSQGSVTALDPDRKHLDIRVAKGYPENLDDEQFFFGGHGMMVNLFDPQTREFKRDSADVGFESLERLGPGVFRFHLANAWSEDFPIAVGDLVAWRGRLSADVFLNRCAEMRMEDLVFLSASGFCIHENGGAGGSYYRYAVRRGPIPDGAEEAPLLSANADAFHSSNVRRGPTLERCHFEYMDDDGIPIHGSYAMVLAAESGRLILAARSHDYLRAGDLLRIYDLRGADAGAAKVTQVRTLKDFTPPRLPPEDFRLYQDPGTLTYLDVDLEHAVPAEFSCLASNAGAQGNGFVIRDCVIRNHRARGMLIKAGDGLIENCLVEGSTMGGIVLSPEMTYWNEADYARGVVIRNTTIRDAGIWRQAWNPMAGALTIAAFEHGRFVPVPGGHRGIRVEDCRFENNDGPNVVISSAEDVVLRNNTFVNAMRRAAPRGSRRGVEEGALIWVTESRDVRVEGSAVENPGPFRKTDFLTTAAVQEAAD